ncbi:hypothetical protein ACFVP0_30835 [Streptomyces cinereoruber]|uniref:hypothetical protein n=1 Tax=Streptomyces cinereoruber TaxID=67260 RepID=UPI0036CE0C6E
MTDELFSPLLLRSGWVLRSRIAKAAMEENMAGAGRLPDERILTLYRRWAADGAGLLIAGNVMVHAEALAAPAGVVLDEHSPLKPFAEWARTGESGGGAMWMQINHPGRPGRRAPAAAVPPAFRAASHRSGPGPRGTLSACA